MAAVLGRQFQLRRRFRLKIARYSPVGRSFYSPDLGRRQPLDEGLDDHDLLKVLPD
ncbi:hypothetical protein HanHA300_Chr11g0402591 [Helianthus annuus]|nr:hypothetical protein HanHA300_Chr11g0402591 [Helianthus annuus]KAJ0517509.1 hypothetical protein HanHA89_Chr11g0426091 [Helianthus annuus]KAJ0685519.1 hypothetical protein HanLR1_Chr11g0403531 [Helianthus annuus]